MASNCASMSLWESNKVNGQRSSCSAGSISRFPRLTGSAYRTDGLEGPLPVFASP
jgi:hypothetical protein